MPDELVQEAAPQGADTMVADAPAPEGSAHEAPPASGPDEFTPEYVHKLREEAASYRTEASKFKDTFDGYDESEVEAFLDLARTLKTDPVTAAEWFEQVAKNIRGGQTPEQAAEQATTAAPSPADDRPLTRAELDAYIAERETQRAQAEAQQNAIKEIHSEMKELGVDPDSIDGMAVMKVAYEQTGGDIKAAYKIAVEDRRNAVIEAYLAEKAKDADIAGNTAPGIGGIPSGERAIKNLDDSAAAMKERLARSGL